MLNVKMLILKLFMCSDGALWLEQACEVYGILVKFL